jgi:HEAT repeat protein
MMRVVGHAVVPRLLELVRTAGDENARRLLVDLLVAVGVTSADLEPLLKSPDDLAVAEGLMMLALLGASGTIELLTAKIKDARPGVRAGAAHALAKVGSRDAARIISDAVKSASFDNEPLEVKRALLESYASSSRALALAMLEKLVKQADVLLGKKDHEELALLAIDVLPLIRSQRTVEILKSACNSKKRRIAENARVALQRMKDRRP